MRFPRLVQLMGAYLNQDFDLHGQTVDEVLEEYVKTNWAPDVAAAVQEIDVLLAEGASGLLARFQSEVSRWDLSIGDDDAEAHAWLVHARSLFAAGLARGEAQEPPASSRPER